ncbi:MAG: YidB family protein [Hyphomicrobiales bacterium]
MGLLDDVLEKAVPKGSLAKPLMIALAALIASGALHGKSQPAGSAANAAPGGADTGLLAGLGGLLSQFQQGGLGDVIGSWIGGGQNQPVSASQLASALGPSVIKALAEKTGLPEDQLTAELSKLLPSVVDKLTPNGRLPTPAEAARHV